MGEPLRLDEAQLDLLADKIAARLKPPPTLVTKEELARALRVSMATVNRLCRAGMPRRHIGDMPRFELAECQEWALSHGEQATKTADVPARSPANDDADLGPIRLCGKRKA